MSDPYGQTGPVNPQQPGMNHDTEQQYAGEAYGAQGGGYGAGMGTSYGPGYGAGVPPPEATQQTVDAGLLQSLPSLLRTRHTEQFVLGLAIGAGAAWVLSNPERRATLAKAGIKLYTNVVGGLEELKEQMADLKAEVDSERGEG